MLLSHYWFRSGGFIRSALCIIVSSVLCIMNINYIQLGICFINIITPQFSTAGIVSMLLLLLNVLCWAMFTRTSRGGSISTTLAAITL